jgi:hypothetical protein
VRGPGGGVMGLGGGVRGFGGEGVMVVRLSDPRT